MKGKHEYPVSLASYNYWMKRAEFLMPVDSYSSWTVFMVEEGEFRYKVGNGSGLATKWDIVFCPPGIEFHREVTSEFMTFHFMQFHWREEIGFVEQYKAILASLPENKLNLQQYDRILDNFRLLRQLNSLSEGKSHRLSEHVANDIWMLLWLETEKSKQMHAEKDALMSEVKQLLEEKAFEGVRIKEIAGALRLTKVQVTRRFFDAFGVNPMDYLTSIRMQKAKLLLTETDYTIDQISRLCGYDNGFYFSRAFKNYQHVAPKEYRKTHSL